MLGEVHLDLHVILLRISRGIDHHFIANAHIVLATAFGREALTEVQGYSHTILRQFDGLEHDVYFWNDLLSILI